MRPSELTSFGLEKTLGIMFHTVILISTGAAMGPRAIHQFVAKALVVCKRQYDFFAKNTTISAIQLRGRAFKALIASWDVADLAQSWGSSCPLDLNIRKL